MAADNERRGLIEKIPHIADYLLPANRVIFGSFLTASDFGDYIGNVQRIVKAIPSCICSIERIA